MNKVEKAILKRIKLSKNGIKEDDLYDVLDRLIKGAVWKYAASEKIAEKIFGDLNGNYGHQLNEYWRWYGETINKAVENLVESWHIVRFTFNEYYTTPFSKWRYQTGFFFVVPSWNKRKIEKESCRVVCFWNDKEKLRATL